MIGRIVGMLVGAVIAVTGYGMLKPALFARYIDFGKLNLGPFGEYRTTVGWLIVVFGVAVAVAAVQRSTGGAPARRRRSPPPVVFAPAEVAPDMAPLQAELSHPEPGPASAAEGDANDHLVDQPEVQAPEPAH